MEISVIVPVYNNEKYIEACVDSILIQPEVKEVLLIDDGSSDNSYYICQELDQKHKIVKALTYPDRKNRGSAEARNLGVTSSQYDFIAFLDSDDIFYPSRFKLTKEIFDKNPNIDGVYEGVDNFFEEGATSFNHLKFENLPKMHMLEVPVEPDDLLRNLLLVQDNLFLLQGLTVKKTIFEKTGPFDKRLRHGQDSDIMWKMAAVGTLLAGSHTKAIAGRRIHTTNITFSKNKMEMDCSLLFGDALYEWAIANNLPKKKLNVVLKFNHSFYIDYIIKDDNAKNSASKINNLKWIFRTIIKYPISVTLKEFWKYVPIIGRF